MARERVGSNGLRLAGSSKQEAWGDEGAGGVRVSNERTGKEPGEQVWIMWKLFIILLDPDPDLQTRSALKTAQLMFVLTVHSSLFQHTATPTHSSLAGPHLYAAGLEAA